jgi:hypothetical protein
MRSLSTPLVGPGLPLLAGVLLSTGASLILWGVLSWVGWILLS